MTMFAQHGQFSIERQGQLLLVDAAGPFNHQIVQQLDADLAEHEAALCHRPWVELAVMRNECAYTPEALNDLLASMQRRHHNNMRAIALQFEQSYSSALAEQQLKTILSQVTGLQFAFFEELQEAMSWCQARLNEFN